MFKKVNHIYPCSLIVFVIFNFSCSPKTLSVFFDGVPNPDDTVSVFAEPPRQKAGIADNNEIAAAEIKILYSFHPPYQQKECTSCHNPNVIGQILEPLPGLCYQCHEDYGVSNPVLHAPVEAGECLSCHNPHMAHNKHLLQKTGPQLCFECHDSVQILQEDNHLDIADDDCIDCHNPHGGKERFILN